MTTMTYEQVVGFEIAQARLILRPSVAQRHQIGKEMPHRHCRCRMVIPPFRQPQISNQIGKELPTTPIKLKKNNFL